MVQVVWTARARADLDAIYEYVARDSAQIARVFTERLLAAARQLRDFPLSGRIVPEKRRGDIREVLVRNYRIIYRASNELVEILTVHHGARQLGDPEKP